MTENLPQVIQDGPGQNELDVEEVYRRVQKVQAVKGRLMKENIHYGKIPGTDRDTLFKAGAETLMMAFRLSPKYTHTETWSDEHLTILSRCDLYHIGSGNFVGSGEGMCSTMESKYRYRLGAPEPTLSWQREKAESPGADG